MSVEHCNAAKPALADWLRDAAAGSLPTWEQLPELQLYMDQVLTFVNRQLTPLSAEDRPLTSGMINNYVKDGVLPRPERKKYSRDHLARLLIICMLKPVCSLPDIHRLLDALCADHTMQEVYVLFADRRQRALTQACQQAGDLSSDGARSPQVLDLLLQAASRQIIAQRILDTP